MGELGQGIDMVAMGLVTMILSLTVHECAHAFAASRLGDPTARNAGRLTLNPLVHIDPVGTIFLPVVGVLMAGGAFFGWARPTPFRADKMRPGINRRLGAAIVSAAGPASNLLLATLSFGALSLLFRFDLLSTQGFLGSVSVFFFRLGVLNVGLALFNMLPIPPLDGHRLLPPMFDGLVARIAPYGLGVVLLIFMVLPHQISDVIFGRPYHFLVSTLANLFGLPFLV